MIIAVLILVRLEKKIYSKIAVTDIVILMSNRLKIPSMDWNIIHQILLKIVEIKTFPLHVGIASQEIKLDYNDFNQNFFFVIVIY